MIQPSHEAVHALAVVVRQYPHLIKWLDEWQMTELERLPHAVNNAAVAQGRCQVLNELVKLAHESPELATRQT